MAKIALYRVLGDPATGMWIGQPKMIGIIDEAVHAARIDTLDEHYDTFEQDGKTCAVIVEWETAP